MAIKSPLIAFADLFERLPRKRRWTELAVSKLKRAARRKGQDTSRKH